MELFKEVKCFNKEAWPVGSIVFVEIYGSVDKEAITKHNIFINSHAFTCLGRYAATISIVEPRTIVVMNAAGFKLDTKLVNSEYVAEHLDKKSLLAIPIDYIIPNEYMSSEKLRAESRKRRIMEAQEEVIMNKLL